MTTTQIDAGTVLRASNTLTAVSMMLCNGVGRDLVLPILTAEPARHAVHFEGVRPAPGADVAAENPEGCTLAAVGSLWSSRIEQVSCPECRRHIGKVVKSWGP